MLQLVIETAKKQVMVNANKFVIIGIEAFGMHTKVAVGQTRGDTKQV